MFITAVDVIRMKYENMYANFQHDTTHNIHTSLAATSLDPAIADLTEIWTLFNLFCLPVFALLTNHTVTTRMHIQNAWNFFYATLLF